MYKRQLSGFSTDLQANITSRGAVKPAIMTGTSTQQAGKAARTAPATAAKPTATTTTGAAPATARPATSSTTTTTTTTPRS